MLHNTHKNISRKRRKDECEESDCSTSSDDEYPESSRELSDTGTASKLRSVMLQRERITAVKLELESERDTCLEHRCHLEAQFVDLKSFQSTSEDNHNSQDFLDDIQLAIKGIESQEEELNAQLSQLDKDFGQTFDDEGQTTNSSGQVDLQQKIQQEKQRLQDLQLRKANLAQTLNGLNIDRKSSSHKKQKRRRVEADDRVLRWLQGSCYEAAAASSSDAMHPLTGEAIINTTA